MIGANVDGGFDEKAVQSHCKGVIKKFVRMYGQDVRSLAKRMMKKGKKPKKDERTKRSKPGEAPLNQTDVYKKLIEYGINDDGTNVSIGPVQFNGRSQGAKALEHGGKAVMTIRPLRPTKPKRKKKARRKKL